MSLACCLVLPAADVVWVNDTSTGQPAVLQQGPGGMGHICTGGTYCTDYGNPASGMLSFDHILWAWLAIFQCITQESWTGDMYYVMDAVSWYEHEKLRWFRGARLSRAAGAGRLQRCCSCVMSMIHNSTTQ